jgi:hypothetical protein
LEPNKRASHHGSCVLSQVLRGFVDVAQLSSRSTRPASPAAQLPTLQEGRRRLTNPVPVPALPPLPLPPRPLPGSHFVSHIPEQTFPSLPPARLNQATLAPPGTRTRSARTPVHRMREREEGLRSVLRHGMHRCPPNHTSSQPVQPIPSHPTMQLLVRPYFVKFCTWSRLGTDQGFPYRSTRRLLLYPARHPHELSDPPNSSPKDQTPHTAPLHRSTAHPRYAREEKTYHQYL